MLMQDGFGGGAGERRLPPEHLEKHASQSVHIRAPVQLPTARRLLRAHVDGRSHRQACFGQPFTTGRRYGSRNAEVHYHRVPRFEQDVFRLDVSVNDVVGVGIAQRIGYFPGYPKGIVQRKLLFTTQTATK